MATVAFELEYDGTALEAHEMDVRAFAPALLSTADLFQEIGHVANPAAPPVTVNVRATSEGSFVVELGLLYANGVALFASDPTVAALNLAQLVQYAGKLLTLIKTSRRVPIVNQERQESGSVKVTFADGTSLEFPQEVIDLEKNIKVRRKLNELVAPLTADGVDTLRLRQEEITVGDVDKEDLPAFGEETLEPGRQVLGTHEDEVYLTIVTLAFQQENKWRFDDGQSKFFAVLRDHAFIDRIDAGEAFSKLDVIHCRIRRTQWRDAGGLHMEIEVMKVLSHLPYDPDSQGSLFSEDVD